MTTRWQRWQRFAERHDTSESPRTLWAWPKQYRADERVDYALVFATTPTQWAIGAQVESDYGHLWVSLSVGPWHLVLERTWRA